MEAPGKGEAGPPGTGQPGALLMEMVPKGPGLTLHRGLASSAVWAGLPGLVGLLVTSDTDSHALQSNEIEMDWVMIHSDPNATGQGTGALHGLPSDCNRGNNAVLSRVENAAK